MSLGGAAPRLVVAYSTNPALDETGPVEVEFDPYCPSNGWSANWLWREVEKSAPPGALGNFKIRGGYDYREPYRRPCTVSPHSICPGDWFVDEDGEIHVPRKGRR